MPVTKESFSSPEAAKLAGITFRQLDYWIRTGLITPSIANAKGSGTQRRYSMSDIRLLKLIAAILGAGFGLKQVRAAVQFIVADELEPGRFVAMKPDGQIYVFGEEATFNIPDRLQVSDSWIWIYRV